MADNKQLPGIESKIEGTFYEPGEARAVAERYAQSYATVYDKLKNAQAWKLIERAHLRGKRVLEIGCGGGYWTRRLLTLGAKLTVVERSPHLVEATKYELSRHRSKGSVVFVEDDILSVGFDDEFDFILAKDVIEHVTDDRCFMKVVSRAAKYGASILISTQNSWSLNYLIEVSYQRLIKGNEQWMGWDPTHLRFYSFRSLRALCKANGFRPKTWFGTYHIPYRMVSPSLEHSAWHVLERLGTRLPFSITGWTLGVVAKKELDAGKAQHLKRWIRHRSGHSRTSAKMPDRVSKSSFEFCLN